MVAENLCASRKVIDEGIMSRRSIDSQKETKLPYTLVINTFLHQSLQVINTHTRKICLIFKWLEAELAVWCIDIVNS